MNYIQQLSKAIKTILWAFPAMMLSDLFILGGLNAIYTWIMRPPLFWVPLEAFIFMLPFFQAIVFIATLLTLSIAISRQASASSYPFLRYVPHIIIACLTAMVVFSAASTRLPQICGECEWMGWFVSFAFFLFLFTNLVIVFAISRIQISEKALRYSFLTLLIVVLGMALKIVNVIILGVSAWNVSEHKLDNLALYTGTRVFPGNPQVWLLSGMIMVSLLGCVGICAGFYGTRTLFMRLRSPEEKLSA